MDETINDIIKRKKFKSNRESNEFLLHAGYSIDELFKINKIKPSKKAIAFERLATIIEILNEGWYPNWENENEYKYVVYFKMKGGFSYWNTIYYITTTDVPSALCLKSEKLVEYMLKHYLDLYKHLYL